MTNPATIYITPEVRAEMIRETLRGYQSGVATLCRITETGRGYVAVMASSNWSEEGVEQILDLSDTDGHGGYIAGILGGDISIDVPEHPSVLQFWEGDEDVRLNEEFRRMEGEASQAEWDAWVAKEEENLYTLDDAECDLWAAICEDVERGNDHTLPDFLRDPDKRSYDPIYGLPLPAGDVDKQDTALGYILVETDEEIEQLEKKYDDICMRLDTATDSSGSQIDGVGLDGDWDAMSPLEKITALEAGITEAEAELTEAEKSA